MKSDFLRARRRALAVLVAAFALSLFCIVYPVYVIWPFRAQGARELAAALFVLRFRMAATVLCALAALAAAVSNWRAQPRRWRRVFPVAAAAFTCMLVWLASINIYELMFHPDLHPSFQAAAQSKLDKDEKVIAVNLGGVSRAYPIRIISYHHVINDVIDKVAIVATY